jgi:hypothetical protein
MRHFVNLGKVSCDFGGMGWLYVENFLSNFYAIPARGSYDGGRSFRKLGVNEASIVTK